MVARRSSRSRAPRSSPAFARSRAPERTDRASSVDPAEEGVGPAGELGDPGRLPVVVRDRLPQRVDLRRHPLHDGLVPPRAVRVAGEDQGAEARVGLDEAAVQPLDLGDDLLGVDGPVLRPVVLGLGLHQDGDEDRLDQQGDRDEGQALLEDRELGVHVRNRCVASCGIAGRPGPTGRPDGVRPD